MERQQRGGLRLRYLVLALLLLPALWLGYSCNLLDRLFRPAAVVAEEFYASQAEGASFDHARFGVLLAKHVRKSGLVDYAALAQEKALLDAYLQELAQADFDSLSRDEKLAFLINAYNACTLFVIAERWPLASIKDIPAAERWDAVRWKIGNKLTLSLNQIENDYLRKRFKEPRIHFAINCASIGCPPLLPLAYDGSRVDEQLQEQAVAMHSDARWFRFEADTLHLTKIYLWFEGDFVSAAKSVLGFASRFSAELAKRIEEGHEPSLTYMHYDWTINVIEK